MAKKKKVIKKRASKPSKEAVARKVAELSALARMQQMQGQMPQSQMPMQPMGRLKNPSAIS